MDKIRDLKFKATKSEINWLGQNIESVEKSEEFFMESGRKKESNVWESTDEEILSRIFCHKEESMLIKLKKDNKKRNKKSWLHIEKKTIFYRLSKEKKWKEHFNHQKENDWTNTDSERECLQKMEEKY